MLVSQQMNNDPEDFVVVVGGDTGSTGTPILPPVLERRNRIETDGSYFLPRPNPNYFDHNQQNPQQLPQQHHQSSGRTCTDNISTMEEGRRNETITIHNEPILSHHISITLGWYCVIGIIIAINGVFHIGSQIDLLFQLVECITFVSFAMFNIICLNSKLAEPSFLHWFINTFLLFNVWGYSMDESNFFVPLALSHTILPIFIFTYAVFNKI
jgi:hypothetical protein